jgi:hypothetical protein
LAAQGRAALSGLDGVGKTQTAIEYAHRHSGEYNYVLWVVAQSRETLISGYITIAGLLKLSEFDAVKPESLEALISGQLSHLSETDFKAQTRAVDAMKRWLRSHEGWLLILDNADDFVMAREFIPSGKNGHVVLTTPARAVGAVARLVDVQEMAHSPPGCENIR